MQPFPTMGPLAWIVWLLAALALTYATLAVAAKRWHDRDKSGWWSLIGLVPIIGGVWIIVDAAVCPAPKDPTAMGQIHLRGSHHKIVMAVLDTAISLRLFKADSRVRPANDETSR
jgi:uncharacterized membrane protein YhaH (DUF805 family)